VPARFGQRVVTAPLRERLTQRGSRRPHTGARAVASFTRNHDLAHLVFAGPPVRNLCPFRWGGRPGPRPCVPSHSSRRATLPRWGPIRAPGALERTSMWPSSLHECPHSRAFRILYRPPTIEKRSAHRREPRSIIRHGAV
jgi:hypothetical protein